MKYLILTLALVSGAAMAHNAPVFEWANEFEKDGVTWCRYESAVTGKFFIWEKQNMVAAFGEYPLFLYKENFDR